MVKIVFGNIFSKIFGVELTNEIHDELNDSLSYPVQNARFILQNMNKQKFHNSKKEWDGIRRLYWKKGPMGLFYTGMLAGVVDVLKKNGIKFYFEDERVKPEANCPQLKFLPPEDFEQRKYQSWTVDLSYKASRGIIEAATGSGKTLMAVELIGKIQTTPFLFTVLSTDLLEQAHDTLSSCLNVPVGKIGGGFCDIKGINVITIQTAIKALNYDNKDFKIKEYQFDDDDQETWDDPTIQSSNKARDITKLIEECKGVFVDECHHAAAKTVRSFLSSAKNSYWRFGGSATPYREDGEEMMLQAIFGKKIVKINASYLIKHGYLVKPYIFDLQMFGDYENYKTYPSIYSHNIVNNKRLNEQTIRLANHFESMGLTTLILVKEYEHGDNLLAIKPNIPFIKGNQSRMCRKNAINDLRSGQTKVAIATTLADEGLDIKRLGAVIIAGGGKSITRVYQRVGRTLRTFENKDKAFVVTFKHHCKFLDKHGSRVSTLLKKEEEFVVKKSTEDSIISDINCV